MKKLFSWAALCMVATFLLYACQEEDFQENINQDTVALEESINMENLSNPLYRDFFNFNYVSSSQSINRNDGLIELTEQT